MALSYLVSSVSSGLRWVLSLYIFCFVLFVWLFFFVLMTLTIMRNQVFCRMFLSLGYTISISCETTYMTYIFLNFLIQLKVVNKIKLVKIDGKKKSWNWESPSSGPVLSHCDRYFWDWSYTCEWRGCRVLLHRVALLWNHRLSELEGTVGACGLTCHCCLKACYRADCSGDEMCTNL